MRFIPLMVYLSFIPFKAYSECNYKDDIKKNQDGSYTYSRDCHIEFGKTLEELEIRKEQLENTQRIVTLKDLAIQDYERNANLWKNTSIDLNDRLSKIDSSRNTDKTLYFVMGAATVILSVFAASKAMK
jgi:hypothetical protein